MEGEDREIVQREELRVMIGGWADGEGREGKNRGRRKK
jgi:hypothetical protein